MTDRARTWWLLVTIQWALTSAHHAYGGIVFGTGWRIHGLAIGLAAWLAVATLWRHGRPRWAGALGGTVFGAVVGLFEGGYNHVVKALGYAIDLPRGVLEVMYPGAVYEPPGDLVFEISGMAQLLVGVAILLAGHRLLNAPSGECQRPKSLPKKPVEGSS